MLLVRLNDSRYWNPWIMAFSPLCFVQPPKHLYCSRTLPLNIRASIWNIRLIAYQMCIYPQNKYVKNNFHVLLLFEFSLVKEITIKMCWWNNLLSAATKSVMIFKNTVKNYSEGFSWQKTDKQRDRTKPIFPIIQSLA